MVVVQRLVLKVCNKCKNGEITVDHMDGRPVSVRSGGGGSGRMVHIYIKCVI